jgi:hypothetical protein
MALLVVPAVACWWLPGCFKAGLYYFTGSGLPGIRSTDAWQQQGVRLAGNSGMILCYTENSCRLVPLKIWKLLQLTRMPPGQINNGCWLFAVLLFLLALLPS